MNKSDSESFETYFRAPQNAWEWKQEVKYSWCTLRARWGQPGAAGTCSTCLTSLRSFLCGHSWTAGPICISFCPSVSHWGKSATVCSHSFSPSLPPLSPDSPAFPMGEVIERGGLAHQSNASLIVAAVWVGERVIRKQRESRGKRGEGGWQRAKQGSVVSQRHRLMIATRTLRERWVYCIVSHQTGGERGFKGTQRSHGPSLIILLGQTAASHMGSQHSKGQKWGWEVVVATASTNSWARFPEFILALSGLKEDVSLCFV